jgi:hypothetical protein
MTSCVPCPAAAATSTTSAGSSKGRGFSCVSSPMPDGVGALEREIERRCHVSLHVRVRSCGGACAVGGQMIPREEALTSREGRTRGRPACGAPARPRGEESRRSAAMADTTRRRPRERVPDRSGTFTSASCAVVRVRVLWCVSSVPRRDGALQRGGGPRGSGQSNERTCRRRHPWKPPRVAPRATLRRRVVGGGPHAPHGD